MHNRKDSMCICKYIYNIYLNLCLILQTKHKQKPHRSSMIIHSKMNFTRNSCETSGPDLTTNLLCSSNFPVPLEPRKNPPILNIIWVGLIGILMVVYMVYYSRYSRNPLQIGFLVGSKPPTQSICDERGWYSCTI